MCYAGGCKGCSFWLYQTVGELKDWVSNWTGLERNQLKLYTEPDFANFSDDTRMLAGAGVGRKTIVLVKKLSE